MGVSCLLSLLRKVAHECYPLTMDNEIAGSSWEWTIADRLRKARVEKGFTQEEFEKVTEISRGTISNLEKGDGPYKQYYLLTWAKFTDVSFEWLMTGKEANPSNSQAS